MLLKLNPKNNGNRKKHIRSRQKPIKTLDLTNACPIFLIKKINNIKTNAKDIFNGSIFHKGQIGF